MENIEWIKDVIFLLPIAGLVWSAATLAGKVKRHDKELEDLKLKQVQDSERILSKLDLLADNLAGLRTEIALLKQKEELEKK